MMHQTPRSPFHTQTVRVTRHRAVHTTCHPVTWLRSILVGVDSGYVDLAKQTSAVVAARGDERTEQDVDVRAIGKCPPCKQCNTWRFPLVTRIAIKLSNNS